MTAAVALFALRLTDRVAFALIEEVLTGVRGVRYFGRPVNALIQNARAVTGRAFSQAFERRDGRSLTRQLASAGLKAADGLVLGSVSLVLTEVPVVNELGGVRLNRFLFGSRNVALYPIKEAELEATVRPSTTTGIRPAPSATPERTPTPQLQTPDQPRSAEAKIGATAARAALAQVAYRTDYSTLPKLDAGQIKDGLGHEVNLLTGTLNKAELKALIGVDPRLITKAMPEKGPVSLRQADAYNALRLLNRQLQRSDYRLDAPTAAAAATVRHTLGIPATKADVATLKEAGVRESELEFFRGANDAYAAGLGGERQSLSTFKHAIRQQEDAYRAQQTPSQEQSSASIV